MFEPIKDIILIIIKRKKLFLKSFLILTAISLVYILLLRVPIYTSHAKIFINSKESSIPSQSLIGGFLGNPSDGARDVQILSEIIIGNSFFNQLLNSKQIIHVANGINYDFKTFISKEANSNNTEKMHTHFLEILEMSFDSKRQIITIGVESKFKKTSKNLSSLLLNQIESSYFLYKNSLEKNKIESILIRLSEVEESLSKIQNEITSFRKENLNYERSPKLLIEYENFLRERLILEQTIGTLYSQKEMSEIEMKLNRDLFLIINEPYIPTYKDEPSNRKLFFMLAVVSLIISLSVVILSNELKTKESS